MSDIPFNDANVALIRQVGEALLGTCNSLDDNLELVFGEGITLSNFDSRLLQELDDCTMECQVCNWWCETGELDDNQVCDDCRDKEDEE